MNLRSKQSQASFEILGIGAPCLDYILKVNQNFLDSIPGPKEGMQPVDYETFLKILADSGVSPILVAGGSACNTIKGLAMLRRKCAILGKIGSDEAAKLILERLKSYGIIPLLKPSKTPTAQVASLVSEDGSRTFRTFLGAGSEMDSKHLDPAYLKKARLVHIEGYTLAKGSLAGEAVKAAKAAGAIVSFDLASFELALRHKSHIMEFLPFVDVLFANAQEVESLTKKNPEEGCEELKKSVKVSVVFLGREGCLVGNEKHLDHFPAYPVDPIDTTGAGDLFASGFLHGYLSEKSMKTCAHYGALLGAAIVQVHGAEIPDHLWEEFRTQMS